MPRRGMLRGPVVATIGQGSDSVKGFRGAGAPEKGKRPGPFPGRGAESPQSI